METGEKVDGTGLSLLIAEVARTKRVVSLQDESEVTEAIGKISGQTALSATSNVESSREKTRGWEVKEETAVYEGVIYKCEYPHEADIQCVLNGWRELSNLLAIADGNTVLVYGDISKQEDGEMLLLDRFEQFGIKVSKTEETVELPLDEFNRKLQFGI